MYHIIQLSLIIILLCCYCYYGSLAWQQQRQRRQGWPLHYYSDQRTTTTICRKWKHQRRSICFSYLRESKRSLPLQQQLQRQERHDNIDDDHYELSDQHKEQQHHRQRRGLRLMHGIRRTFQRVLGAVTSPFHNKKDTALISSSSSLSSQTSSSKITTTTTTTVVTPSSSSSAAALTEDYERFNPKHEQQQQHLQRGFFHWIRRILHRVLVYGAMAAPFIKKKVALSSHSSVPTASSAAATAAATSRFVKDKGGEETVAAPINGAKTMNTVFDEKVSPRREETATAAIDGAKTNNTALAKDATARDTKKEEVTAAEVNGAATAASVAETFNMATSQGFTQNVTMTGASYSSSLPQLQNQHFHHHQPPSQPPLPPPPQQQQQRRHVSGNEIVVKSSLEIPIDAYTAFDAFSDLPRQSLWSPWLHSVEYIQDDGSNNNMKRSHHKQQHRKHHPHDEDSFSLLFSQENTPSSSSPPPPTITATPLLDHHPETRWTASFRGFRFSWDAIHTRLERPILIEWESTSGLKNYGQVVFVPNYTAAITPDTTMTTMTTDTTSTMTASPDVVSNYYPTTTTTLMTLSITFRPPTWLAFLMRSSEKATKFVEERMLRTTLQNFRQALLSEQKQQQPPQQNERATIQNMVETSNT